MDKRKAMHFRFADDREVQNSIIDRGPLRTAAFDGTLAATGATRRYVCYLSERI